MVTAVEVRIGLFWSGALRFGRAVKSGFGMVSTGVIWHGGLGFGMAW